MVDLAQLEGFEATSLEIEVAHDRTFQRLRRLGWPRGVVQLATGLPISIDSTSDGDGCRLVIGKSDTGPNSPKAAAKRFDELGIAQGARAMWVLLAKIFRDLNPQSEFDLRLQRDFILWLEGKLGWRGFRWEEHDYFLEQQAAEDAWEEKAAKLRQKSSNMIALLTARIPSGRQKALQDNVLARCQEVRGVDDEAWRKERERYSPWVWCQACDNSEAHGWQVRDKCRRIDAVVAFDCGDTQDVMSWIDPNLREMVRVVRFTVPRTTFRDQGRHRAMIKPSMLFFDLHLLDDEKVRSTIQQQLERWVNKTCTRFELGVSKDDCTSWHAVKVIKSHGETNALIVAGHVIKECDYWQEAFDGDDLREWIGTGLTVSRI